MKVGILGAGLIGSERVLAVQECQKIDPSIIISGVFDPDVERLQTIQEKFGVRTFYSEEEFWNSNNDWVFLCLPHHLIFDKCFRAFKQDANILVEKPLGRNLKECESIVLNKPRHLRLHVGFNYRFFDGVEALLKDCVNKKFGDLVSVNMILGHGNAPGMENSWKLNKEKCGGGCLIDPGIHLIDLMKEIGGDQIQVQSANFWSGIWNTDIEEEVHIILSDERKTIFNLQTSLNRWRSAFKIEVNGTTGYGVVEGRGRSYGEQTYRIGKKWGWREGKSQAESEILVIESDCSNSFIKETKNILLGNKVRACNDLESLSNMELLDEIYRHERS